jgi:hypothetical protein
LLDGGLDYDLYSIPYISVTPPDGIVYKKMDRKGNVYILNIEPKEERK